MNERIVFLGTPTFAATILEGLIENKYNIVGVVSQPDALVGRKKIPTFSAVKEIALKYQLPLFQPYKLKDDYQFLLDLKPDLLITCAYGQLLSQEILNIATINNINVHASLLPLLRGGAPIHHAIIDGHDKTGVSIMQMIKKMDAGVVYSQEEFLIPEDMNTTTLFERLQYIGRDLLLKTLPSIIDKSNAGVPQDESKVTYGMNIKREEEKIDFTKSVKNVHNLIRGLSLNPGAYCMFNDKTLKIYQSKIDKLTNDDSKCGTIKIENKKMLVKCSNGYLEILSLQLEGKKIMTSKDFINGNQDLNTKILV